jgi:hypothetical protein
VQPNGTYNTSNNYIINGYYGEWLIIKLPNPIILTRFRFYPRPLLIFRSPGLWKCYGSNDGITFTEILPEKIVGVIFTPLSKYLLGKKN